MTEGIIVAVIGVCFSTLAVILLMMERSANRKRDEKQQISEQEREDKRNYDSVMAYLCLQIESGDDVLLS